MEYKKVKNAHSSDVRIEHNIGANWVMDYYHFHNLYEMNALFRDITGLSFHQYLVRFRIIKAKEMLECGNVTTTQACFLALRKMKCSCPISPLSQKWEKI